MPRKAREIKTGDGSVSWVCTNPEERWTIVYCSNNKYKFINGYDGLCMDIQSASTNIGADVQVYPYEGTSDQKWFITPVS